MGALTAPINAILKNTITEKGLLLGIAANTPGFVSATAGLPGQVLVVDPTTASGFSLATPSGSQGHQPYLLTSTAAPWSLTAGQILELEDEYGSTYSHTFASTQAYTASQVKAEIESGPSSMLCSIRSDNKIQFTVSNSTTEPYRTLRKTSNTTASNLNVPSAMSYGSSATGAAHFGANTAPFALTNGWTLVLRKEGNVDVTATFNTGDFADIANATAAEVVTVINTDCPEYKAYALGNAVYIQRKRAGADTSFTVRSTSTAASALGFTTDTASLGSDGAYGFLRSSISMLGGIAGRITTTSASPEALGYIQTDMVGPPNTGALQVVAKVTTGDELTVTLYDVTAAASLGSVVITSDTTVTDRIEAELTPGNLVEIRASVDAGTGTIYFAWFYENP